MSMGLRHSSIAGHSGLARRRAKEFGAQGAHASHFDLITESARSHRSTKGENQCGYGVKMMMTRYGSIISKLRVWWYGTPPDPAAVPRSGITITPVGNHKYMAVVRGSSPYAPRSWTSEQPMGQRLLIDTLFQMGWHLQDVGDAFSEADPAWIERPSGPGYPGIVIVPWGDDRYSAYTGDGSGLPNWQVHPPRSDFEVVAKLLEMGARQAQIDEGFNAAEPGWARRQGR